MTALSRGVKATLAVRDACAQSTAVFLRDAGHGLLEVSHNTLALVGLAVVAAALFVAGRDDIRHTVETQALGWLQARHDASSAEAKTVVAVEAAPAIEAAAAVGTAPPVPVALAVVASTAETSAVSRATASDPKDLTRQQSAVAHWLARRGAARRARPDADPGHHGHRVELQPVRAKLGRRAGADAGDDDHP